MALKYVVKKRVFGFDKTKTEKYVAQNVITNTVNFRDLCKEVSMFGMIPEGAVKHVIDALIDALNTNLNKGLSVQLGDFGCFRPGMNCKSQDEEKDVVLGFDLGADDYVIKPFRNRELVSRIRNVLRRTEKIRRLTCGNIAVEPDTGKVYRDGEPIAVTKLEYKILMTLFSNPHKIFTREEILNGIWDMAGNFVNDNTLTVTMKRLREKLGDKEGNVIVTVRGIGYRLNL